MSERSVSLRKTRSSAVAQSTASWWDRLRVAIRAEAVVAIALLVIALVGGLYRFTGLDWDENQHLHPDERFLTMVTAAMQWPEGDFWGVYFNEAQSTLNPRNVGFSFWVYGDFPVIAVKRVSMALGMTGYGEVYLVGRAVSALVDLGTLLAVFALGRALYRDNRIAVLGAALYAMTALAIQQAHFYVVDNFSTFFVAVALVFMARVAQRGRLLDYAFGGAFIGLAMSSKISIYSIVVVMGVAGLAYLARQWRGAADKRALLEQTTTRLFISGLIAFAVFRVAQPYAFLGPNVWDIALSPRWLANALEARAWVSGERDAPFAHQWTDRAPILFPLQNMVLWGVGIPLGVAAWIGFGVALWLLVRRRSESHLIPVVWTGMLFLLLGTQWVKSLRYFLPIYPTLILFAAWLLVQSWDQARRRPRLRLPRLALPPWLTTWTPPKAGAVAALVVVGTFLWATAFTSIYTRPHTRVEASRWIIANIPAGSTLITETQWDDGLPLRVDGLDPFGSLYRGLNLDITAEDTPQKLNTMLSVLDQGEYIIISSNRQYDSMPRLPMRFPMVINYYDALFSGSLGFRRIAEFTSYPQVLGLQIPDQSAEEAWHVYDHPRVQIFQKTSAYSRERAQQLIAGNVNFDAIVPLWPIQASRAPNALVMTPDEASVQRQGGTWSERFNPDNLANRVPALVWAMAVSVMGVVALPYLWLVARSLPDLGYGFAKPLGLLLVGWTVWWAASVPIAPFGFASVLASVIVVGGVGVALVWRDRNAIGEWLRGRWGALALHEGLFWAFFAVVLGIRWANPDLWHPILGGEKPMDFAYLNAVAKSTHFPPYDPWFAGGYINYYYLGFVLVAALINLTSVVPAVAYNLAIPTFFAFLAMSAFSVTLALLPTMARGTGALSRTWVFAGLGALFVAVIGNLAQFQLIVGGLQALSRAEVQNTIPIVGSLVKAADGLINGALRGQPLPFRIEWWYWNATRVIDHPPTEAGPITELPWFTFLYADLHAHLMALPYTVVVIGLALTLVRQGRVAWRTLQGAATLIIAALTLGALWAINTWDLPTYALLMLAAFLVHAWRVSGLAVRPIVEAGVRWALTLVAAYALWWPYHTSYGSAVSGVEPWTGSRTTLLDYLTIHGFFLFIITAALFADFAYARDLNPVARLFRLGLRAPTRLPVVLRRLSRLTQPSLGFQVGVGGVVVALGVVVLLLVARAPVPALIIALSALAVTLFFRRPARGDRIVGRPGLWQVSLVMILGGLLLTLAVEYVVLKGIDIGRMNTVFKFYLQVWILWGIASAVGAARVFSALSYLPFELRAFWRYGFVALFALTLLYPLTSTPAKIADRFDTSVGPTLDGEAFMTRAVHRDRDRELTLRHDLEAIRWMQRAVVGSPVIAEGNTHPTLYGWGNRFAMFTGNPSIVGWDWHQRQQRSVVPDSMVTRRVEAVQQAYASPSAEIAHAVFRRFGVEYVIVGELERAYFPGGVAKFDQGVGRFWTVAYQNPGVTIYRMIDSETPRVGRRE